MFRYIEIVNVKKIRNKMFYILTPIYLILLLSLYPVVVPKYYSEGTFLLGWLVFVLVISLIIRFVLNNVEKKQ